MYNYAQNSPMFNPLYNTVPASAPGLEGLRFMLSDIVASVTGGMSGPYVAPNQGVYEAMVAKAINAPLYDVMSGGVNRQLGRQIGDTVGAMGIVQQLGKAAGVRPEDMEKAIREGAAKLGSGFIGKLLMPMADSMLNRMGLTGGSILAASNAAYAQRFNLMTPGGLIDPMNYRQQYQAMAAASAVSTMLNGLMSQTTPGGGISLLPNLSVTQNFERERLAALFMNAAGRGMFTNTADATFGGRSVTGGGLQERLQAAAGWLDRTTGARYVDLMSLRWRDLRGDKGVFTDEKRADQLREMTREVAEGTQGIAEALAAMRDLTHEVDGAAEKLDDLTNGDWLRSRTGLYRARDATRKVQAIATAYNLDPNAAISSIKNTRHLLQRAAGFDDSMIALGFNGGGLFGLGAQTELLADAEALVTARGVRGDPVLANRLRMQHNQAMARTMNTMAGRGAQVLAYARQLGIVGEDEADRFAEMLASGDRSVMTGTLNQLLTTVFGSAAAGRRFMNNQMQMNNMRMSMDDEAGAFAWRTAIRGTGTEFLRQGTLVAGEHRLAFTKQLLAESGMRSWQGDGDVDHLVQAVQDEIIAQATPRPEFDRYGKQVNRELTEKERRSLEVARSASAAFRHQVETRIAGGMTPMAALAATKAAFERNPLTAGLGERIEAALTRTAAERNEGRLNRMGRDSYQATSTAQALLDAGFMTGEERLEVARMVMADNGADALERVRQSIAAIGDEGTRRLFTDNMAEAGNRYDESRRQLADNEGAERAIAVAHESQYGASTAAEAYRDIVSAYRELREARGILGDKAYEFLRRKGWGDTLPGDDKFLSRYAQSKFAAIFTLDEQKEMLEAAKKGDDAYFEAMGRKAAAIQRMNVDNQYDNGYGNEQSGFWGGGTYAGNSAAARKDQQDLLRRISSNLVSTGQYNSSAAATLAQDLMSLTLPGGDSAWEGVLRQFGDSDGKMGALFKNYSEAFRRYTTAQSNLNAARTGDALEAAWAELAKNANGGPDFVAYLSHRFAQGLTDNEDIYGENGILAQLRNAGVDGGGAYDVIEAYAKAQVEASKAQKAMQDAVANLTGEGDAVRVLRPLVERDKAKKAENTALYGERMQKYVEGLDVDVIETDDDSPVGEVLNKAYDAAKDVVKDKEVAARHNVKDISELTAQQVFSTRMRMVLEKAESGSEKEVAAAKDVLKGFKVADKMSTQRISGKITLTDGKEQRTGSMEGSVGGGLGR